MISNQERHIILLTACISFFLLCHCSKAGQQGEVSFVPTTNDSLTVDSCRKCIVLTDQSTQAILIVDVARKGKIVWKWQPQYSNIQPDKVKWFSYPDDAKPVYGNKYLLINASGGGVALIRISDGKAVFYAYAGKNPHSSELLPDGNIITASSTDNRLVIFHADSVTAPESIYRKVIFLPFAHNVVWDKQRKVLWSAGNNYLYALQYNFDCRKPDLIKKDSFQLPGNDAHDLFPVYGKDSLWFTNTDKVYTIDLKTKMVIPAIFKYVDNIKSVSSGPDDWPVIAVKPETKWWTDKVLDSKGNILFRENGMKIYKARWFLPNPFSYDQDQGITFCQ